MPSAFSHSHSCVFHQIAIYRCYKGFPFLCPLTSTFLPLTLPLVLRHFHVYLLPPRRDAASRGPTPPFHSAACYVSSCHRNCCPLDSLFPVGKCLCFCDWFWDVMISLIHYLSPWEFCVEPNKRQSEVFHTELSVSCLQISIRNKLKHASSVSYNIPRYNFYCTVHCKLR